MDSELLCKIQDVKDGVERDQDRVREILRTATASLGSLYAPLDDAAKLLKEATAAFVRGWAACDEDGWLAVV
jgi:hypothetical protein